jgi:CRISPR-associated protein Csm5
VDDRLVVVDVDKLSEVLSSSQIDRLAAGVSLKTLIDGLRVDQKEALAAYTLASPERDVQTIRPHIKLPGARPYLPGSTLKGALRTALAWCMLVDGVARVDVNRLKRSRYWASSRLEQDLFGRDPNHDLLRALQVGDSAGPAGSNGLELARVAVYSIQRGRSLGPKGSRFRFHLEVVPDGVDLSAEGRRDNFILGAEQAREKLDFGSGPAYLSRLPYHANRVAEALIEQESEFYRRYGPAGVTDFYGELQSRLDTLDRERTCLLQAAWGTGWTGKTVGSALSQSLMTEIRARYRLGRRGQPFPKTRRLIERSSEAVMPLGWLEVTFEPVGEDRFPELAVSAPQEGTPPTVDERLSGAGAPARADRTPGTQPRTIDDLQVGQIVEGKVEGIASFGAFVDVGLPFNGLIHISELREGWVDRVEDVVHRGQEVRVRVIEIDADRERIGLSLKRV